MSSWQAFVEPVKRAIREAIAGIEYPGDDRLSSSEDDDEVDVADFRGRFVNATWGQVPSELIDYNYDSLPFFSPQAYRFFLPAYLLYAFDHRESNVLSFIVYNSIPPKDADLQEHFIRQKAALTQGQAGAVLQFLQLLKIHDDSVVAEADEAIQGYWKRFADA